MSVYASTPGFVEHRQHPRTLLLIVVGHAALIAAVMAAKMDLPQRILHRPIIVNLIPETPPPPPEPQAQHDPDTKPIPSRPKPEMPVPIPQHQTIETTLSNDPFPIPIGPSVDSGGPGPAIAPDPVLTGPRFATPAAELQPLIRSRSGGWGRKRCSSCASLSVPVAA